MSATTEKPARPPTEEPVYWFVRLEQALDKGDFVAAQHATDELKRLGVHVRYGRPRPGNGGEAGRAS
jgi:hypothetical protein